MAPSNGTTSTPPKLVVTIPSGTLQWHPAMAPSNGTRSTPAKLVITLPPNHSTLQWHPAMAPRPLPQSWSPPSPLAPCNGTQQWHSPKVGRHHPLWHPAMAMAPRPLRQSWPSPSPPTAMAPRPLHPAMAPWCHVQSAKVVRRPPPPIGSKNPYSYRYLGKNEIMLWKKALWPLNWRTKDVGTCPHLVHWYCANQATTDLVTSPAGAHQSEFCHTFAKQFTLCAASAACSSMFYNTEFLALTVQLSMELILKPLRP